MKKHVHDDVLIGKRGVNYKTCCYMVGGSFCGALALGKIPMPGSIPDMPVCRNHKKEFVDWDESDTERIANKYFEEMEVIENDG